MLANVKRNFEPHFNKNKVTISELKDKFEISLIMCIAISLFESEGYIRKERGGAE